MATQFKKDLQYFRFSLYGFLKNQKFYEPFFLLFLLNKDISYLQVGILYSIREITINLLEIPAGIIADSAGRRRTMLISFAFYIFSFILFYLSSSYSLLIVAIIVFGIGEVFRTGTHKAMIYDYLEEKGWSADRVTYYGHTRSWSQRGSAVSSLIAAAIVVITNSYNLVFLFAIVPYLLNFINLLSYPAWLDGEQKEFSFRNFNASFIDVIGSLIRAIRKKYIIRLYTNSTLVSGFYNSAKDYLQPLLVSFAVALPLLPSIDSTDRSSVMIGLAYFVIYLLTSRASMVSGKFALKAGSEARGMNISFLLFTLSGLISGLLFHYGMEALSILFFVLIFVLENLRRPICVAKIASETDRSALSTYLSVDSQLKSLFTMVLSPLIGLVADLVTPGAGVVVLSILLLVLFPLIRLKR